MVERGTDGLPERQAAELEGLAFDWIINAERYIESRYPELLKCRNRVNADWFTCRLAVSLGKH